MATVEDGMRDAIAEHVECVRRAVGASDGVNPLDWWPDEAPASADDAAGSWWYVMGYAHALESTAGMLISELGL